MRAKLGAVLVCLVVVTSLSGAGRVSGQSPRSGADTSSDRPLAAVDDAPVSFNGSGVQPLVPARVLDTRDGTGAPLGALGPGSTLDLQVSGRGGVPAVGAGAVVLNLVSTEATHDTYVTAYPAGVHRPVAANLNVPAGTTVANLVVVKLGEHGRVTLYNLSGATHLVADVQGWFPEGGGLQPMTPTRLLDTREGNGAPPGPVAPGSSTRLQIAGRGGIPATGVGAVVMNVAVTEPTADSYLTVFPSDVPRPLAANLNFTAGQTIPNLVIAKVGGDGAVDLFNYQGHTHIVADVAGWFPDGSAFNALPPSRLLDTRDGTGATPGRVGAGAVLQLQIAGRAGIPATGVGAVVLNVTVTEPDASSYITVWPGGIERPLAANLNMRPGQTVPNLVIARVGSDGTIQMFNFAGSTHIVADVAGWFAAGSDDDRTTLDLKPGTTLAGPGDVIGARGDPTSGGEVILSGSADVPPIGGHLSIFPHDIVPDGLFGAVTGTVANQDGTTTVAFSPAVLGNGFDDIRVRYRGKARHAPPGSGLRHQLDGVSGAINAPRAYGGMSAAPADTCSFGSDLGFSGDIGFGEFDVEHDFDLGNRYVRLVMTGSIRLTYALDVRAAMSCTVYGPAFRSLFGVTVANVHPGFSLTFSGGVQGAGSTELSATFGFQVLGTDGTNLSRFGVRTSDASSGNASYEFRPFLELDLKAFGLVGLSLTAGLPVTVTYEPPSCVRIAIGADVSWSLELGTRWLVEWTASIAAREFGPWTIAKIGCPDDPVWAGSIEFSMRMSEATVTWGTSSGTFDHDYAWRVQSADTSLVSTSSDFAFGPGENPPADTSLTWFDVNYQDHYTERNPQDNTVATFHCVHSGGGFPGVFSGRMHDTNFELIEDAAPNQIVYLGLTARYTDAPQVGSGSLLGLYACDTLASGPHVILQPGVSHPSAHEWTCLGGTIQHGGECLVVARVSPDGRHIDVDLQMSGQARTAVVSDVGGVMKERVHSVDQRVVIRLSKPR